MAQQPAVKPLTAIVGLVVLAAGVVATVAVLRSDPYGQRHTVESIEPIDESLIGYEQTAEIETGLNDVRALAVAPDGTILVGGDGEVRAVGSNSSVGGESLRRSAQAAKGFASHSGLRIELPDEPKCLAVGGEQHAHPGRIYVGTTDYVLAFAPDGQRVAQWERPAEGCRFTAIAAGEEDVLVADSAKSVVWRFDLDGKLLGRIGQRDQARNIPGFVITDREHFDLAIGPDGLVYVVNPRLLRIEAYTMAGDLRSHWGKGSTELDGFCGCCNPTDLAAFSDGRFVTAEKGVVRVKVYGGQGKLQTVVAGPQHFRDTPADLAVDARGRVLVLDGRRRSVRVFEAKSEVGGEQ